MTNKFEEWVREAPTFLLLRVTATGTSHNAHEWASLTCISQSAYCAEGYDKTAQMSDTRSTA